MRNTAMVISADNYRASFPFSFSDRSQRIASKPSQPRIRFHFGIDPGSLGIDPSHRLQTFPASCPFHFIWDRSRIPGDRSQPSDWLGFEMRPLATCLVDVRRQHQYSINTNCHCRVASSSASILSQPCSTFDVPNQLQYCINNTTSCHCRVAHFTYVISINIAQHIAIANTNYHCRIARLT